MYKLMRTICSVSSRGIYPVPRQTKFKCTIARIGAAASDRSQEV